MPIGKDYLAIDRAIEECAYAGCNTIIVVANEKYQPLLRQRVRDYILDPVYMYRSIENNPMDWRIHRRFIPIYMVPYRIQDLRRRESMAYSIIHGAIVARKFSKTLSWWLYPQRYYVAPIYGIYPPEIVREHRRKIHSWRAFYLNHNKQSILDNQYMGFTIDWFNIKKVKNAFFKQEVRTVERGYEFDDSIPEVEQLNNIPRLPYLERDSGRWTELSDVFNRTIIDDQFALEVLDIELPWYYNISTWEDYKTYMGSAHMLKRTPHMGPFYLSEGKGTHFD